MPNENTPNVPSDGQTPNTDGTSTGQTPTPQGQTTISGSEKTPISSLPADIQDYIKRLRDEAEEANKKQKAEARAKQQAEEQRLAEQGQYKQLAEQHAARVQELEPVASRYEALAAQVHAQIEVQIKDWPPELKTLVPDKDTPVDERIARVEQLKPLLEKLQQQARSQSPGNSPNPKPAGNTPEDLSKAYEKKLRVSGSYFKI